MVMPTPAPARDLSIPRSLTVSTQAPPSADALVEILERSIATGELPPGSKLPSERELSVQCGVSRPVVREALRSLQERGDIEIRPSRGAYVRAVRPGDVAGRFESFARQRGA
ncbi:MAG TPA: GntR family transcriptional regulator, partial [Microbacterium sp.]|nr:GntR family transcriptional regulator [Microbacterium sp.]